MNGNERNASALQKLNSSANKHLLILRFEIHFYGAGKEKYEKTSQSTNRRNNEKKLEGIRCSQEFPY